VNASICQCWILRHDDALAGYITLLADKLEADVQLLEGEGVGSRTFPAVKIGLLAADARSRGAGSSLVECALEYAEIELASAVGIRCMTVDYKNDLGNGYTKTLLCFLQLFIVSNRSDTWYFANNNNRHFSFNADERFLPLYQFAGEDNKKITHLDSFAETFLTKCTLGQMISRYMVLVASEQKLMMRPYQFYAVIAQGREILGLVAYEA
jgi:hypothetical protein